MPASFEARLIPHRSIWTMVRMTWLPMLAGVVGVGLAFELEAAWPEATTIAQMLPMLGLLVGAGVSYLRWGRGPALSVAEGVLVLGPERVPVDQLAPRVDEYVYQSQARYGPGKFWLPLLVLRLESGERRIIRRGGGGGAQDRPTSARADWELEPPEWDQLARAVGATKG